jgi:phosphoribosylcarboxyaminoimidazole (NCAIR) mutase
MSSYGVLCRDLQTREVLYDSRAESTMFWIAEEAIAGPSVGTGAGLTFSYPAYAGKKIVANLVSPYQSGDVDGWAVLSCRVSYPSGVPTVQVFVDNATAGLPVCDGYLVVYFTGAAQ